ncbi:MAG: FIST N-terminal domain-containing protein [Chloroflexota bacterium]
MAVGRGDELDPEEAIASAIDGCRSSLAGQTPQAGMLFSAFDSFDPIILDRVREAFPGVSVMGTTSAAEISSDGFAEDSITLALFASDEIDISTGLGVGLGQDVDAACREAVGQALAVTTRKPRICIVLTEGFAIDPQHTLDAMARALPDGVVMVGGTSAGHDFSHVVPSYQFRDDRVAQDGVAILLLSGPVRHSMAVGTGWRPIGSPGVVTGSRYGALEEIDGRPALAFIARYLDTTGPATFGNPLAFVEAGVEEAYLRAIQGSDPATGAVFMGGSIPVGASVQLTTAASDDILTGTENALHRAADGFPAGSPPEAALIFSCAVRQFVLGSRTRVEADLARSVLGPTVPIAGLYCYGEIGPVRGAATSRFLNETFIALLLGT